MEEQMKARKGSHNMIKRTLLGVTSVAVISLVAAACSGSSASPSSEGSKGVVYYLSPSQTDEFQVFASTMIEDFLTEAGYEAKVLSAGSEDSTLQQNQLDTAIAQKPKAIILEAVDPVAIVSGVDQARQAGIPVIVFERIISDTTVDFTSITNNFVSGASGGQAVVDFLKAKYGGDVKGRVLSIEGSASDPGSINLEAGFRSIVDKYPDVTVDTKTAGNWDGAVAASVADDYLTVNPDTDYIFAGGGFLGISIIPILEAHGMKPGAVGLSGWGGTPVELEAIRSGWMTMTIDQPLFAETYGTVQYLDDIIAGKSISAGSATVQGWTATITIESYGPQVQIDASAITTQNVEDPKWWANIVSK